MFVERTNYAGVFRISLKILTINYFKNIINLILGIVVMFLTIFAWLQFKSIKISDGLVIGYDPFVIASGIGVSTIRNCMYNLYRVLYFMRKNGVVDKLYITPVSKTLSIIMVILFYWVVNFIISVTLFGFSMIYEPIRSSVPDINWLMFMSGFLLLTIFCNLVAFIMAFGFNSFEVPLVIGSIFYFFSIYILGVGIPYSLLLNDNGLDVNFGKFIYYFTFLLPVKYPLNIMQAGWINSPNFNLIPHLNSNDSYFTNDGFGYGFNSWLPYLVSIVIIFVCVIWLIIIVVKKYEVGIRHYKRKLIIKEYFKHVAEIRKATSVEELNNLVSSFRQNDESSNILIKRKKGKKLYAKK